MSETVLVHHGIKGQKWGVRRYTDRNGNLTPRGAKRYATENAKKLGASKRIAKLEGHRVYDDSKSMKKINKAINRIDTNNQGRRYSDKQKAKDYSTAINGLNYMKAKQATRAYSDTDWISKTAYDVQTKRNVSPVKVDQYLKDSKVLQSRIDTSAHEFKNYEKQAKRVIDKMKNDKAVTYRTFANTLSSNTANGMDTFYEYDGTSYTVKKNTKRRSKSKRYNDPVYKQPANEKIVKRKYQINYY